MTTKALSFVFLCLLFIGKSVASPAPETGWLRNFNHLPVQANLQLTGQFDAQQKQVNALLNINLDEGWKTYWRSPGEGGVAPSFSWSEQSINIDDVQWFWPAPKRYPVLGVETLGYQGLVSFPLSIQLIDPQQPAYLRGTLTVSSCTTICVLTDYQVELDFQAQALQVNQEVAFAYAQAMSLVPQKVDAAKLSSSQTGLSKSVASWDQKNQQLVVQLDKNSAWLSPRLFVDSQDPALMDVFFAKPVISTSENQLTASFAVTSWAGEVDLSAANINLTVLDDNLSLELQTGLTAQTQPAQESSLALIFIFALIGGLILNIMPCVLPVLGMKLSSVLSAHGQQQAKIRKQFIASSVGIISSFWLLALFLLILKLSGQAIGWGIQFQSPIFISFMVLVTALFTVNMLGLFEIQLPSSMQTWLASKGGHSYVGHYLQGMFATLLATPCSAPFLGTAVAFALGASVWQLFIIFTALGLGMALPWIMIALFPKIALKLPKPGRWMGSVKLIFALLIFATCLWLITLLANFIGNTLGLSLIAALTLVLLLFTFKKHHKRAFVVVACCVLVLSVIAGAVLSVNKADFNPVQDEINWQPLDTQLIKESVAQGKVVFVDVTADWCITCKANKVGVLLQDPVYKQLQQENIVAIKGDWTVRSQTVTDYLQSFNRYGVPFNVVYGPAAPQGIELPTLLTSQIVEQALQQAKGQ